MRFGRRTTACGGAFLKYRESGIFISIYTHCFTRQLPSIFLKWSQSFQRSVSHAGRRNLVLIDSSADDGGIAEPFPRCHSPAYRTTAVRDFGSYPRKSSRNQFRRTCAGEISRLASATGPRIVQPAKALHQAQSPAFSIANRIFYF